MATIRSCRERSLKPPVFHTSTFVFRTAQDGKEFFELAYGLRQKRPNEEPGLIYSRINNPDLEMLEDRLAIWDEAEDNLTFASGMAAISTTLWAYARPGSVIVHSGPVYGGTDFLLKRILPQFGVDLGRLPGGGRDEGDGGGGRIGRAASVRSPRSISRRRPIRPTASSTSAAPERSPTASGARTESARWSSSTIRCSGPLFQTPLAHGADLVVTSLTKYVGGHSDLIAGGCSGATAALEPIRGMRTILGTMCDPHTGWLLMRSLETLKLRMTAAAEGARKVADFLAAIRRSPRSGIWAFCPRTIPIGRSSSASARARARPSASRSRAARPKPSPCWTGSK